MMNLMQCTPEKLRFMAISMPPIINERRGPIAEVVFQMEDRHVIEPAIPGLSGQHRDSELNRVDEDHSSPPRIHARQCHGGPQALRQNTTGRNSKNDEDIHGPMISATRVIVLIDNLLPDY